ncbi:hypothetical protein TIFTF001_038984 [Ficus carica]|uniref:Uncharacterized protein n=1 Tax=Ficus carica TaxID=3494 RepID=A0AA88E9X6_FICCA|nr:hypothetical protein TIFTF001_038984 [Ficus carica]
MSFNQLSGEIPDCWSPFKGLEVLILANNEFMGEIPMSIGSLTEIKTLRLGYNSLTKELPSSLKSCTNLMVLDVQENRSEGPIPTWIGESRPELYVLSLRSNHFSGSIPPRTAMSSVASSTVYPDELHLVWKGKLSKFDKTLGLVKSIDLSGNKLIGILWIYQTINFLAEFLQASLKSLVSVYWTYRTTIYPEKFQQALNSKASKPVHIQGIAELFGAPLLKMCPGDEPTASTAPAARNEEKDQDKFITREFYVTLGLGFVVGFWGVCGSLIFNKTWRYSYFNFLNDVNDWIYVMVAVHKAKLLRMIKN